MTRDLRLKTKSTKSDMKTMAPIQRLQVSTADLPVSRRVWLRLQQLGVGVMFLSGIVQLGIESTLANFLCVLICLTCPFIVIWLVFRTGTAKQHPIPVISIMLYVASYMILPLLAKTQELQPLTYNLAVPAQSFALAAVGGFTLAISYLIYSSSKTLARMSHILSTRVFEPLCVFRSPTDQQLWMMGAVGALATVYMLATGVLFEKVHHDDVTLTRLAQGFMPLQFAPFLILARHLFSEEEGNSRSKPFLLLQFGIVVVLGMGLNGRALMALPIVNLGVWALLGAILGIRPITGKGLRRVLIFSVIAMLLMPVVADLATAVVVARATRHKTTAVQLIQTTVESMSKKSELENARARLETKKGNDIYVHNEILSRFIDIKFLDLMLDWGKDISPVEQRDIENLAVTKVIQIFPAPITTALGLSVNKDLAYNQKSFADYFYDERYATPDLVARRTGNVLVVGLLLHGLLFFPLFALAGLVMFTTFDSFIVIYKSRKGSLDPRRFICISPAALVNIYPICGAFLSLNSHDSEIYYLTWIVRDLAQMLILYWFVFKITAAVSSLFTARRG